ncbi:hypothetical protein J6590_030036 [Homalodisca vitripennis]|nr:hypothetical protein J6590_030036 [Homalodisca vitripennis]
MNGYFPIMGNPCLMRGIDDWVAEPRGQRSDTSDGQTEMGGYWPQTTTGNRMRAIIGLGQGYWSDCGDTFPNKQYDLSSKSS